MYVVAHYYFHNCFRKASQSGLILTVLVAIVYKIALMYEG